MSRIALLPDEPPDDFNQDNPLDLNPEQLAAGQAQDARGFMEQLRAHKGLRFPWTDLDKVVGPILPGWLVAIGGRAKAGKTTLLCELLTAWTELGKTVVYIGTETQVSLLRYTWAAVRCNVPIDVAIDPNCPVDIYERLMEDVEHNQARSVLSLRAIFADAPDATLADIADWVAYAEKHLADALIFDHLSRLDVGQGERWQALGDAVRGIKKLAVKANLTVVVGAQLTQGQGGSILGEHEVPGNGSWAGTANVQRECDVGIQLWRPFKPGITNGQKQEARDDATKVEGLVQEGVMGVRVAAHRWRGKAVNQFVKLYVNDGQISGYTSRTP